MPAIDPLLTIEPPPDSLMGRLHLPAVPNVDESTISVMMSGPSRTARRLSTCLHRSHTAGLIRQ
jgi:hypothetical protein